MSDLNNSPFGLSIMKSQIGNGGTQKIGQYDIYASADGAITHAGDIFSGDMVKMAPLGNAFGTSVRAGTIVGALTPVTANVATQVVGLPVGVFLSCEYFDTKGNLVSSPYWPANTKVKAGTKIKALVNDDPEVIFKIQISTSTNNRPLVAQGDALAPSVFQKIFISQNANLGVGGIVFDSPVGAIPPGNPSTGFAFGKSAYYLDGSMLVFVDVNGDGRVNNDIKVVGLIPEAEVNPNPTGLIQGVNMPFISVLCKFNRHIHGSTGTPGLNLTA